MVGPIIVAAVVVFILIMFFSFVPVGLWISSMASGVRVGIFTLIGMRLRRVVPARIILPLIKATKAGIALQVNQLEAHYLAGGNVDGVVDALIAAERAGIDLPFEKAAAIDLAGRNVLEAVKMSVNPKVIETPNISAVAKDGIELLVKARVTVRTNLERLVGGAGEATIIARIGEGIVTTVGSAAEHKRVLENPDDISKLVLSKGLDAGTAFEILFHRHCGCRHRTKHWCTFTESSGRGRQKYRTGKSRGTPCNGSCKGTGNARLRCRSRSRSTKGTGLCTA